MKFLKTSRLLITISLVGTLWLTARVALYTSKRKSFEDVGATTTITAIQTRVTQRKDPPVLATGTYYADHLLDDQRVPLFRMGQVKRKPTVAVGIPSITRNGATYLLETLGSMLENLTPEQRNLCVFIIYLADQNITNNFEAATKELYSRYNDEFNAGIVEVIGPPEYLMPDWESHVEANLGDKIDRARWRSKQNLDEQFLMSYIIRYVDPVYYLMMEDDVLASKNYMTTILEVAASRNISTWYYASFSAVGGAAKLFHYQSTREFSAFIGLFWNTKPLDWLFWDYARSKYCGYGKECKVEERILKSKVDLFKHLGKVSSKTNSLFGIQPSP
nr:alpha-1,3-mannosyl-glycoprotein 4-beta-N-acetylglucosaminyltransferase A-like [Ciona intestinalis]|eukprot:XP_002122995.1 alpha-1,3-mannosyl-glycoprotein 4-beta-N-acetylglucosaminyltransferase A-like [Ciona intestinalis]